MTVLVLVAAAAALGVAQWFLLTMTVLHTLALLGIGEGTPFTNQRHATQRLYRGDLSLVVAALVAALLVAGHWVAWS